MNAGHIGERAPQEPSQVVQELQTLFSETASLFHCLQATADAVHRKGSLTAGLRGVLFGLAQQGPQTVPQMARLRPTSRQHIQVLVNRLQNLGLVLVEDNPNHRRSKLVGLTAKGERTVAIIRDRETNLLALADVRVSAGEITSAVETLRSVRTVLLGSRFRRLVEELGQLEGEDGRNE